jgi:hypothetical protein
MVLMENVSRMTCFSFARIPKPVFGAIIFVLGVGCFLIGANIDLLLNPWIRELQLEWWNSFTTEHYFAWLYADNFTAWLILTLSVAAALALAMTFARKRLFKV